MTWPHLSNMFNKCVVTHLLWRYHTATNMLFSSNINNLYSQSFNTYLMTLPHSSKYVYQIRCRTYLMTWLHCSKYTNFQTLTICIFNPLLYISYYVNTLQQIFCSSNLFCTSLKTWLHCSKYTNFQILTIFIFNPLS